MEGYGLAQNGSDLLKLFRIAGDEGDRAWEDQTGRRGSSHFPAISGICMLRRSGFEREALSV